MRPRLAKVSLGHATCVASLAGGESKEQSCWHGFSGQIPSRRLSQKTVRPRLVKWPLYKCCWHGFYTEKFLHFTQRPLDTEKHAHTEAFTQGSLLHRGAFTQRSFTQRSFYKQKLLHKKVFTNRSFYEQTHLHTEGFTHKYLCGAKKLLHGAALHCEAFAHRFFTRRSFYTE